MRNWLKFFSVGVLVLGLAACNDIAEGEPGKESATSSELTIQELFQKTQEASENQKSMHAEIEMTQNIKMPGEDLDMESKTFMEMDMVLEPMSMYQRMEMEMEGVDESIQAETYMTSDGFFMKEPDSDSWIQLPNELLEQLSESILDSADPTLDFGTLVKYVEDFKFEQDDKNYILKLKASGENFQELVKEQLDASGMTEGMGEEELAALETMIIHQMDYEIFIDKKTFYTNAFNMVLDIEMPAGDEMLRVKQNTKAQITKINEIKEIKIPQEVIDNAVEQ
ncbi:DUF6612 family protein [Sporosarcina siberiensis]|uniref:DUF6612 family protein n=1 Tax=Sporosarcina siberiensis TaxID=1365606 RepID=A0ABW4SG61_9BACL